ncbi:hypothetical protein DBR42_08655, partial [Pelomonas sp. HMWF004]
PQASPGGLKDSDAIPQRGVLMPLQSWLDAVQASGQDAVPEDDEVFSYADTVGLPRSFVALCWREFKRRQLKSGKRQRDWRERFRECVTGNWYGLWLLAAGQDARLSTNGEQARRLFEAQDGAAEVAA